MQFPCGLSIAGVISLQGATDTLWYVDIAMVSHTKKQSDLGLFFSVIVFANFDTFGTRLQIQTNVTLFL